MSKRKTITNKTRFEVFKRDSFTCQYCGGKAPDIVLNVDHIKPVSKGGKNDIINLITSCFECNSGKRDRELTDNSVLKKQRDQMEQLNERKQQLEMMMEWRDELNGLNDVKAEKLVDYISTKYEATLSDEAIQDVKKWVKKYPFEVLLDATDRSYIQYYDDDPENAFIKIERIAYYTLNPIDENLKRLYYIRGIAKKRLNYINDNAAIRILKDSYNAGVDIQQIERVALTTETWSEFRDEINKLKMEVINDEK